MSRALGLNLLFLEDLVLGGSDSGFECLALELDHVVVKSGYCGDALRIAGEHACEGCGNDKSRRKNPPDLRRSLHEGWREGCLDHRRPWRHRRSGFLLRLVGLAGMEDENDWLVDESGA